MTHDGGHIWSQALDTPSSAASLAGASPPLDPPLDGAAYEGSADSADSAGGGGAVGSVVGLHQLRSAAQGHTRVSRAEREKELADGAVGELWVHVLYGSGLVAESQTRQPATLAPDIVVGVAVGEADEQRGESVNASAARVAPRAAGSAGGAGGAEVRLDVMQHFRLVVHDTLTQKLALRVLVKGQGNDLGELASAQLSISDLRLDTPAARTLELGRVSTTGLFPLVSDAVRPDGPGRLQLHLTYRLLQLDEAEGDVEDGRSFDASSATSSRF